MNRKHLAMLASAILALAYLWNLSTQAACVERLVAAKAYGSHTTFVNKCAKIHAWW